MHACTYDHIHIPPQTDIDNTTRLEKLRGELNEQKPREVSSVDSLAPMNGC